MADQDKNPAEKHPGFTANPTSWRGLSERQWFVGLLVASGLLLLITFRGCILPSGVGPKSKPSAKPTATASVSATAVPTAGGKEYTVQGGDTLSKIAQENQITLEQLAQANNFDLNKPVILRVGQKLKIPKS